MIKNKVFTRKNRKRRLEEIDEKVFERVVVREMLAFVDYNCLNFRRGTNFFERGRQINSGVRKTKS
jgi:hypothetical protein